MSSRSTRLRSAGKASPTSACWNQLCSAPRPPLGGQTLSLNPRKGRCAHARSFVTIQFVDGNKRTAVVATFTFYALNGWAIQAGDIDVVALAVDAAEGHLDVATIAKVLSGWAMRLDLPS